MNVRLEARTNITSCSRRIERLGLPREARFQSQTGASLVELAFVIPFLVLLALGAIDFGRAYYLSIEVANAARAGAQYGAANGNLTNLSGMQTAANQDAFDVPGGVAPVAVWGCECSDGSSAVELCSSPPTCPGRPDLSGRLCSSKHKRNVSTDHSVAGRSEFDSPERSGKDPRRTIERSNREE